ncbi:variable surface lipoprotein [Mycoplasma tauri]|uniref:variable surface lipoprotein n=1 Tax=Mycoplasma tauri TaxID=547987 RepID=UPI001CBC1368|nr:variable surface lipoprotein [Mycoplasma tauri]MBZ4227005.1 variable surface lipoprotein [Mycoplasma tauri]
MKKNHKLTLFLGSLSSIAIFPLVAASCANRGQIRGESKQIQKNIDNPVNPDKDNQDNIDVPIQPSIKHESAFSKLKKSGKLQDVQNALDGLSDSTFARVLWKKVFEDLKDTYLKSDDYTKAEKEFISLLVDEQYYLGHAENNYEEAYKEVLDVIYDMNTESHNKSANEFGFRTEFATKQEAKEELEKFIKEFEQAHSNTTVPSGENSMENHNSYAGSSDELKNELKKKIEATISSLDANPDKESYQNVLLKLEEILKEIYPRLKESSRGEFEKNYKELVEFYSSQDENDPQAKKMFADILSKAKEIYESAPQYLATVGEYEKLQNKMDEEIEKIKEQSTWDEKEIKTYQVQIRSESFKAQDPQWKQRMTTFNWEIKTTPDVIDHINSKPPRVPKVRLIFSQNGVSGKEFNLDINKKPNPQITINGNKLIINFKFNNKFKGKWELNEAYYVENVNGENETVKVKINLDKPFSFTF